ELGEVEATLLALPWVREAVVVARDGVLAAYVALAGEIPDGPEEALRDALRERLPAPFVPSFFVVLDALPRTPNGKVDRKALPAPAQTGASGSAGPAGIVEETLAAIWGDLLGRPDIGRHDRFFDLGGHSLLATRALARVREAWGAEIPLGAFFEEPTLAGLARRIEAARHGAASTPIPRAPRDLPLPLSFAQQRFWFLDRLEPGVATYNVPLALRFQGPLDPAVLASALREMVRRHEALRTTFAAGEDGPVQRIQLPPAVFPLPCADLLALPPAAAAAEGRRLETIEARRPFDLEHGPPVRALLMRRSPEEHRLVLTFHHIACDGWSLGLLLADLTSFLAGGGPAPEPPLQYADFAAWQRREPLPEPLLAAWRGHLAGAPLLELPSDRPAPSRRGARGATLVRLLPADLAAALAAVARVQGATLFMALLAGFDALLHRHTGQTDLVVGTVVAGRGRVELERVVGCFVNTLALRIDLDGSWTFGRLLDEARSVALTAFWRQDLPFERLVEEIHPHRDPARRPFPRALVVLQNEPLAPPVLPGLAIGIEPVDTGTARSDLALAFHEAAGGLLTTIELGKDVFDEATVARLWDRFGVLLTAAAADPLVPLAELPLLTEAERQELAAWGSARIAADPEAPTAVRHFERRASQTPEAPALVDGERTLTFGDLDRAANRLAGRLRARGVGPGRIVGLSIERSAEMVVGLLGIWKAGGASLPLDPALPEARRAFLIGDALGDAPMVVTRVDEEGGDERGLEPVAGPRDPAYVIYTSGTTGVPKGVVVEHGQLAALLASVQRTFGFQADDRMPCVAPFSFDIFFFELLAPLLAGGTSVLVGLRPSLDVDRLVGQLGELTRLHAVPALLRQICDTARASGPWPGMRSLFVGGDRVPADLLDDLRPVFPNAEIHVLYGPTEATILATSHRARPGEVGSPIGRPFDHVEIVVADAAGRPVPAGAPGEIRIGGAGVARGYLNRPELNEEKFPVVEGHRMYRSGDLARWRPDGVLEFLGRVDEQVKVRGFRIEPGEVEAAIVSQPGARAAAVIALDGRLVGFVVPERDGSVAVGDLQEALRARLPDSMVPGSWQLLSELPLTSHGKVDRRALATLGAAVPEEGSGAVAEAARGPVEETIAAIFAEVLGRERVGRRESFFDLGGHSLLATRVASRVRSALGAEIPLVAVFDAPTVEGVAAAVDAARGRPVLPPLVRTMPGSGEAPLSFAQQRLWFLDRLEPGSATYNLPVAVRLRGALDVAALEQALQGIVHRHQALRSTFHEGEHGPFQRVEMEKPLPLPLEDLSPWGEEAEAAALRRMAEEGVRPFDLESGPVFRAHLLRIAPGDHLLVANFHHIVSDGWSMGVLVRELSSFYRGLPVPELPVQYADWARWQRGWLVGDVLEIQLGWWREALQGLPERLDLPTDHPRRSVERRSGAKRPVRFGPELTRELATLARRESATLFTIVLAGFQALLGRRAGQDDLAVGSPVAGRTQTEVEGLIGFFANTLVLRSKLYSDPDGHELLRRTRAKVLAAYERQHVPFEKLVEELAPARQLGRTPLFEAMLVFQNGGPEPPNLPEVESELLPVETGTAKFDLLLDLTERDGGLSGSLEYDADLFEAVTIDRLIGQLAALLRGLAATPGERISNILLLAGVEGIQITASHRSDRGIAEPAVFEPPQGPIEEGLAGIWTELLGREGIGRWDSFFDRGGHSLLAAQVVSRVRRAFGVEIPLRTLFEEPTLAGLAERIGTAAEEGSAAPLAGAAGEGPAPLSFAQQRLWFLAQLDAASPAYNLPAAVRLRGSLDIAALERALAELVRRHESLHTRFPLVGGEPAQMVEEASVSGLPLVDLRTLGAQGEAEARRLAVEEGARPFDLQNGPVVRALLLRLADREHRLVVTMHHIVSDGWSLGVFIRELTALYAGLPLPALPVTYRDFAVWQRARLSGETLERSLAFWRNELRGLPAGIDLPADRPRPPVQTNRGEVRPFVLDAATTGQLRGLGRAEGATLFMVLLAGFQALLARWSGQEDLAVGTPIAGRTRMELEGLIGFFVNTLVLRGDLTGDPELRTLVDRTRERFFAAQAHQELPFEKLVEELRPERNLARSPVFQILFVLQNAPRAPLALPGLAVISEAVETGTAKFEIQLTLEEADGGLAGSLDFNRDLFDASTMDRLLGHYAALLAEAGADPGRRAGDLPILSLAESQQLREWNATAVAWSTESTLPARFAVQADQIPDRIAVRFERESLTYRELDERSSRLAWRLRRLGVGPDVVVAVALERSLELIVALYAVHKAGGAYLPLDRSHPDERLSQMLADSGAPVVLTLALDRERFADQAAVVCLDSEAEALAAESAVRPPLEVAGDHLAYVIFTSGSTGAPKGAMNTHAAISNRILWMQAAYRLGASDRVLQKTPSTFDVSVWEFFWPLVAGARLVVARPEGHRDPSYLLRTLIEEGITVLHFVPSMLQVFLGEPGVERASGVRQVMASGEALPADLARRFFEHLPAARLHNLYGPTEAAVDVTAWTCVPGSPEPVVPIGRPIANLEIRTLDRLARPVPVGAPGELCIGGIGLARGYLGQAGLTAERFIPDPSDRSGARLYRTGDLARWRTDGHLEYLGRLDHQVKIRGMRIEPGEIEAMLDTFPAVREAAVLAREDRPGDRRLVAYLVPEDTEGELRLDDLRVFLRERLPEPLVPAAFVVLDAFPFTANGKLDRKALPPPADAQSTA
ncbi:MAG TPA: amino acid adenylation domain-containing protein, partial [Thermoanaerobaculia bacterium]|nr:amino acid adenylation domain-containing protein [Thermoanaerobaculia bacterium]